MSRDTEEYGAVYAEEITDQNRILRAANAAATIIIGGYHQDYETVLRQALKTLAESVAADSAFILRNIVDNDRLAFFPRVMWKRDASPDYEEPAEPIAFDEVYPDWQNVLDEDFSIISYLDDLRPGLRMLPFSSRAVTVMLVTLYLNGEFFGMLGFENSTSGRMFTESEAAILRVGSLTIAASITRNEIFKKVNRDRDEAISVTKAKTEFLSRMSHEIRTPINAIIGMTTLARKNNNPENIDYYLDMIDKSSKQLLGLVNDVLDMSKIEEGRLEILSEPFDFEEMLSGVSSMISVKTAEKKQALAVNIKADFSHEMIGDPLRLSQVLINLLGNATKFTPEGGTITLTIEEKNYPGAGGLGDSPQWLRFTVSDTGIGITPEQQKNLFQVFSQADGTIARTYGGSGLGLSICKKLINLMGGDIRVESEAGKGSDFIFELPVEWGEKSTRADMAESAPLLAGGSPDWHGRTILLAEDIEINREIVMGMLEDTGVEIIPAADGEEAFALYKSAPEKFDLILMDLQMPRVDGLAATKLIRKSDIPEARTVPILAMTANAFKEDIQACIDAGMNAHIAKPIDLDALIRTLAGYFSAT